jgi:hypothetical protein
VTLGNLGYCTPNNASPRSCDFEPLFGLTNTGPFANLQSNNYWSGTVYAPSPADSAWHFGTSYGNQDANVQYNQFYAMAVHPGDVTGMVPEPQTYALMLSGLTALWLARRGAGQLEDLML